MTELERLIRNIIATEGPLTFERYMALCLGHPQFGYYMSRDPFGARGDFITAPEISQTFGELIGVWCAQIWKNLHCPAGFQLVELGPGRGTLMRDAWRATAHLAGFHQAASVQLVETSPVLRRAQAEAVPHAHWHDSISSLAALPSIIIANEFFDALPIRQFERRGGRLFERVVGLESGILSVGLTPATLPIGNQSDGIFEVSPARAEIAESLGALLARHGGAVLVIDYGHGQTAAGDTIQAMKGHAYCGILESPGEADITAHVDFEALGNSFRGAGTNVHTLLTQGDFLEKMGIGLREQALTRNMQEAEAQIIRSGIKRLVDGSQMGHLFKVMAVTSAGQPVPYPFEGP